MNECCRENDRTTPMNKMQKLSKTASVGWDGFTCFTATSQQCLDWLCIAHLPCRVLHPVGFYMRFSYGVTSHYGPSRTIGIPKNVEYTVH